MLSTSVCYSTCNSDTPRKWQSWKKSMSVPNFALNWGKYYRNFWNAERSFWTAGTTQVFQYHFRSKHETLKIPYTQDTHWWTKQIKIQTLTVKWLPCQEYIGPFRALWRTIWRCIILLPNLCSTSWARSRRNISKCAKTFKTGLRPRILIEHNQRWGVGWQA
jgi:hypothetical protein